MSTRNSRRLFLHKAGLLTVAGAMLTRRGFGADTATPAQTMGPFYPIPEIEKQEHFDADLTRRAPDGPLAEGESIVVRGQIVDLEGKPIANSIVEVWQACLSGRYNHPKDTNSAALDPNFQYWARMQTDEQGKYTFKSIQPGKYPGRTPHIHYRVAAIGHPELVTQMYFESQADLNQKDGIYRSVSKEQQKMVTVGFNPDAKLKAAVGDFKIVLGTRESSKRSDIPSVTPPM